MVDFQRAQSHGLSSLTAKLPRPSPNPCGAELIDRQTQHVRAVIMLSAYTRRRALVNEIVQPGRTSRQENIPGFHVRGCRRQSRGFAIVRRHRNQSRDRRRQFGAHRFAIRRSLHPLRVCLWPLRRQIHDGFLGLHKVESLVHEIE